MQNIRHKKVLFWLWIISAMVLPVGKCKFLPQFVQAEAADHLVINEIFVDSVAGTGGTEDDWVELFNPTGMDVSLAGWSVQKTSNTGSSLNRQDLSGTIPAGGHYLIVKNDDATNQVLKDMADFLASSAFDLSANGIIHLVHANTNITTSTDANVIDFAGFGTAVAFEGLSPAPAVPEAKSISRVPDGEDKNANNLDFQIMDAPTPTNSSLSGGGDNNVSGTVLFTLIPAAVPVQNISASGAGIAFSTNAPGTAVVRYGLTNAYGAQTAPAAVAENVESSMALSGLECAKTYHYQIYGENADASESDATADATFTTLPCGIRLDSLVMTKTAAKANNAYADGWEWEYGLTVWDFNETVLKMKFAQWTGPAAIEAGGNMQFSADGSSWLDIAATGAYPAAGADISALDLSADAGRQVKIRVRMKVPLLAKAGVYNSNYGILTE